GPGLEPEEPGRGSSDTWMVPRPDHQVVLGLLACVSQVLAVEFQSAPLVAIVHSGDGEHWHGELRQVLRCRVALIPEFVLARMLEPFVEDARIHAEERTQLPVRTAGLHEAEVLLLPERRIGQDGLLRGISPGHHQPGRQEREEDIVSHRVVEAKKTGCRWY